MHGVGLQYGLDHRLSAHHLAVALDGVGLDVVFLHIAHGAGKLQQAERREAVVGDDVLQGGAEQLVRHGRVRGSAFQCGAKHATDEVLLARDASPVTGRILDPLPLLGVAVVVLARPHVGKGLVAAQLDASRLGHAEVGVAVSGRVFEGHLHTAHCIDDALEGAEVDADVVVDADAEVGHDRVDESLRFVRPVGGVYAVAGIGLGDAHVQVTGKRQDRGGIVLRVDADQHDAVGETGVPAASLVGLRIGRIRVDAAVVVAARDEEVLGREVPLGQIVEVDTIDGRVGRNVCRREGHHLAVVETVVGIDENAPRDDGGHGDDDVESEDEPLGPGMAILLVAAHRRRTLVRRPRRLPSQTTVTPGSVQESLQSAANPPKR